MAKEISLETLYPSGRKDTIRLDDPMGIELDYRVITNGIITIRVSTHGAELSSLRLDATGREYLWQADPAFWSRHAPVLFPMVGMVWEGCYRSHGREWKMGQHGFARDINFQLIDDEPDAEGNPRLLYVLRSSEETLQKYPYRFRLEVGYVLKGRSVEVIWRVMNPSRDEELKFQIGAHPAFYWPLLTNEEINAGVETQKEALARTDDRGGFLLADTAKTFTTRLLKEKGCVDPEKRGKAQTDERGYYPLTATTFDELDTLIFEEGQVPCVTLCDAAGKPYLTVKSQAPVMGLWSPPRKRAPFVCLEPWFGRCDSAGYEGSYEDKDWIQTLAPLGTFETSYQIVIE